MFAQMLAVTKKLQTDYPAARYLFLTLTVKNCSGDELNETLDALNDGFKLLVNAGKNNAAAKPIKKNLLGYARATEITYDSEKYITAEMFADKKRQKYYQAHGLNVGYENPSYATYHPHLHVMMMMKSEYFTGMGYIKQSAWADIWQNCMKLDYTPQIWIETIKPNATRKSDDMSAAISETLKYPIKPDSLKLAQFPSMGAEQKAQIVTATAILSRALHGRRLVTFGGSISKTRRQLKLDDVESGDLIHVDGDEKPKNELELVLYRWKSGAYVC